MEDDERLGLMFGDATAELEIEEETESVVMLLLRAASRVVRREAIVASKWMVFSGRPNIDRGGARREILGRNEDWWLFCMWSAVITSIGFWTESRKLAYKL